ncbi:ATP-binding protein [Paenibacillus sp. NPDC058174]|uniref:ATP-binding protein n=1 Tax=Paenibacillus sp. NPDC058174 TaxID=3346366 RepID=UPI0036D7B3B2
MVWIYAFQATDQLPAVNGQLNLRHWDASKGGTVRLDGEWTFYPHAWLIGKEHDSKSVAEASSETAIIHVPGEWNNSIQPENPTPYGFGTYRLQILVDPAKDITYSIRVPSVRSSSELYVNGRLLNQMGKPASNKDAYKAWNIPFTASFTANDRGVIDVIIQAANYEDPRGSGIIRSIKFGTEPAVAKETQLSVLMQELVAMVFLMHGVYALILFLVGTRDRRLLYFSLLVVSAMLMTLLGSDEKILHYWIPLNYDWGFKLVHLLMITGAFALLQSVMHQLPKRLRKAYPLCIVLFIAAILWAVLMPVHYVVMLQSLYVSAFAAAVLVTLVSMILTSVREIKGNLLLLLALLAFTSNFVWWVFFLVTGIKVAYYPFDLIVSTTCLSSVWFRHYFLVHSETRKLAAKLQETDKVKDRFLANTSHELRNPLHGIINISQAVLEREQHSLQDKSIKDLGTVLSVGRRMSIVLNDLLDVMRLKESTPRLQLRSFSIHTIADGVIEMLQYMTEGKQVRLVNQIPEQFPQVYADENRVIQIVFNLLHNAIKYTNEGEVSVRSHVRHGRAHITVADTGIGMNEGMIRRVFDPYEQVHSDKTMIEGGFGLGLSISKQLVELHGGSMKVRSVPGEGSEFSFTLEVSRQTAGEPVNSGDVSAAIAELAAANAPAAASTPQDADHEQHALYGDRPRIIVVDDDPLNLKVIEAILSGERYDIMPVTSGKQVLALLDAKEWDLVISDVMMPQMSGHELARAIRKRFSITELPILFLTARSQAEDIANAFLAGGNDYVTKPVEALELRSRVKALTEIRQSVRERLRMEAAWLQAQIQPHFLFNTLNAVAALSEIDTERMRDLIEAFSSHLRDKFKLEHMDELAPIEDELSIVRSYLYIEKERFEEKLNVTWEIDEIEGLKIPMLTIQPLVENAIRHGIMKRSRGGHIHIRVRDCDTYAEIAVTDDGAGMDEQTLRHLLVKQSDPASGIGLLNTDLRLKRQYGRGLQITSKSGQGTSVSFIAVKGDGI